MPEMQSEDNDSQIETEAIGGDGGLVQRKKKEKIGEEDEMGYVAEN
jgi:hypothetical protein